MKRTKIFIVIIISIFLNTNCSVWENFTTYFNRYYNAKLKFEEAQELVKENEKQPLFEFKREQPAAKVRQALDAVIEKCSKILQFNQESAYFDEALLMTGKAYYSQGNYTKALRKFQELESIEDTDLRLENKLWMAIAGLQMRKFEESEKLLEEVKAEAASEEADEILYEAYLTEVRYMIYRERYQAATELAKKMVDVADNDQVKAQIYYELGNLYVKMNEPDNASLAYKEVEEYEPSFDVEFDSRLEYAKIRRQLGFTDESLDILDDLRSEDKFIDKWDKIDLEIAEIYYAQGDIEYSLELFTDVDTSYSKNESSGIAAFRRAEIIEKYYFDFDSAKYLYDRINRAPAPKEYKDQARGKSLILKKFTELKDNLVKFERQLVYLQDTSVYRADSAAYFGYYERKDSLKALMTEMKELEGSSFDSTKYLMKDDPPFRSQPVILKISSDSMKVKLAETRYEIGGIFFSELELADSAYVQYHSILTDYPYTSLHAKTLYALGSYYLTMDKKEKADSLFLEVYTNYENDPIVNAAAEKLGKEKVALNSDPAEKKFTDAENKYLSKDYSTALASLFNIVEDHPESPFAPKSLLTIGYILENELNMPDSAASIYDSLVNKYERTDYASAIQPKLKFYQSYYKAIEDSIAKVQKAITDSIKADSLKNVRTPVEDIQKTHEVIPDSLSTIMNEEGPESEKQEFPPDTSAQKPVGKIEELKRAMQSEQKVPDTSKTGK